MCLNVLVGMRNVRSRAIDRARPASGAPASAMMKVNNQKRKCPPVRSRAIHRAWARSASPMLRDESRGYAPGGRDYRS
jgi:hypothetical protein